MAAEWRIQVEPQGEATILRFTSLVSLDESSNSLFHETANRIIDAIQPKVLRFDFGSVYFVSSVTLGTLLELRRRLLNQGASMTIFNLRPQVYDVFKVTHLLGLFQVPDGEAHTEVRLRAYLKWEAAGKPTDDGLRFWLEAERELAEGE